MMKLPCYEKIYCSCLPVTLHKRFFYKKYVGCYGCARSANFVYYFKSIYSCLPLHTYSMCTVLASSPSTKFTILCRNLSKPPRRLYPRGSIYFQTEAVIVSSCPIALGQINVAVGVHTSIATHACMSVSESPKIWPKVSGHKKSCRCETFC